MSKTKGYSLRSWPSVRLSAWCMNVFCTALLTLHKPLWYSRVNELIEVYWYFHFKPKSNTLKYLTLFLVLFSCGLPISNNLASQTKATSNSPVVFIFTNEIATAPSNLILSREKDLLCLTDLSTVIRLNIAACKKLNYK